jgi:hypothetical protein
MSEHDVDAGIPGATVPTTTLTGDEESHYVACLGPILRAARLNNQWPDARRVASHLSALAPEVHRGLYPGLAVDVRVGLPSYREWTRVQTDVRIAPEQLDQLGDRRALASAAERGGAASIHAKQLAKHDYYSDLTKVQLTPLGEMQVTLRRLEPRERRAHFHVVLDKLDVSGLFVRYSIDLAQTDDFWTEQVVTLDNEAAQHTEGFRSLVYKFTSYDAEFTFVKLASIGNLSVERVIKGVIGPFWFPWTQAPESIRPHLGPRQFVANFSLDMAAVDINADRDNDPFEDLIIERLSQDARAGYVDARHRWGYQVFKDRKFVCSRPLVDPLRQICAAEQTKNIIYPV